MRPVLMMLPPALLVACAEAPPIPDPRAAQEAACTAAIAAHTGRPAAEITSRWLSESGGKAQVEALDGNRRHLCDVDATGRVLGYSHPDA